MISPKTLYTIKNKTTGQVLMQTVFPQYILDADLTPPVIWEGSVFSMQDDKTYQIVEVHHFPFEQQEMYLKTFPYNYTTLILVTELPPPVPA